MQQGKRPGSGSVGLPPLQVRRKKRSAKTVGKKQPARRNSEEQGAMKTEGTVL